MGGGLRMRLGGVEGEGGLVLCRRCSCTNSTAVLESEIGSSNYSRRKDVKCLVAGARVKT